MHNPEDMLLASLSACHMLWYLHLACKAGVVVTAYEDQPIAVGETSPNGAGRFLHATLRPIIHVSRGTDLALADSLHGQIHQYCFIARSVNFPVEYAAKYLER
jgi:organic hydroperoxide reductase OsmC/OhrA